jgi:hypothetical protein
MERAMSIIVLALMVAGLAFVIGEILVKDPRVLSELAGTREFALGGTPRRADSVALKRPSNANEPPRNANAA